VPAAAANPQLSFWHWFNIVGGDGGRVQIKPRGGAWTDASTLFVGVANAWNRNLVDLAPFAGQVVQVGFRFGSDYGNEAAGWYIDDVALATFVPNPLALGGTVTNHFTANGDRAYYVIDVPPGGHLRITLNDLDNIDSNELYIRRGAQPTAGESTIATPSKVGRTRKSSSPMPVRAAGTSWCTAPRCRFQVTSPLRALSRMPRVR